MEFSTIFSIVIGVALINNYVLARFLGLCPFLGVSKKTDAAFGMGMAVIFVMTLASAVTWLIFRYLLREGNIFGAPDLAPVLKTGAYILAIAALVQLVEMFLKKSVPALYQALGIYLPLITTNCAVLGVALLNTTDAPVATRITQDSLFYATLQGFSGGLGFTIVLLCMSGIRERLEVAEIPKCMEGIPIAFLCTALMAFAFMGFIGLG
jgi:electron transport complex protein RnfA